MEKYVRKVVQFKSIQGDERMSDKATTSYYKFEKRNDRCKITLSLEGLSPYAEDNYVFCIILKRDHQYSIKQLRTLLVKSSKLNEKVQIEEADTLFVVGALIARKAQLKPVNYLKDVLLIGYQEEEFSLSDIVSEVEIRLPDRNSSGGQNDNAPTLHVEGKSETYLDNGTDYINDNPSMNSEEKTEISNTYSEGPQKKTAIGDNDSTQAMQVTQAMQAIQATQEKPNEVVRNQNVQVNEGFLENKENKENVENKDNQGNRKVSGYYDGTKPIRQSKTDRSPLDSEILAEKNREREEETIRFKNNEEAVKRKRDQNSRFETFDNIKKQMEKSEIEGIIQELFENNQKMQPFENDDINAEWIKIDITDLVFLPIESWMYINNAFLMNCYRKYKHLLLGRKKGQSYIILGVPDIYFFKTSIVANLCGFFEFTSYKNALPKAGDYGYWMVRTNV